MSITLNEPHPIYDDIIVELEDGRLISAAEVEAIFARPTWDTAREVQASRRAVQQARVADAIETVVVVDENGTEA